jgi:hypothetical protein
MLKDKKAAKSFFSAIIENETLELDTNNLYCNFHDRENEKNPVFWLYSTAKITTANGKYKKILVEVKKSVLNSDILNFNGYCKQPDYEKPLPVYTVMIIEQGIDIPNGPSIESGYVVTDVMSGETLTNVNISFLPYIHDKSWIFQICYINNGGRNDVERLMSLFKRENGYIIDVNEEDFPKSYHPVIHRLHAALENEDVRTAMEKE